MKIFLNATNNVLLKMILLYRLALALYVMGIRCVALFNVKAAKWIRGRQGIWKVMETTLNPKDTKRFWIHCASLGEFEQGRPLIEAFKTNYPNYKIVLTFFSPSGYEIRKGYKKADYVFYLPIDSKKHAKRFVELVQPDLVVFVKYEFWHYYLNELKNKGIPTLLISAIFRPEQLFFKSYTRFFKNLLFCFERIFVQNEASLQLLQAHDIEHVDRVGDTRLDRVYDISLLDSAFPIVEAFAKDSDTLICGSTWEEDEAIIIKYINEALIDNCKVIIAPHEIQTYHVNEILETLKVPTLLYSKANRQNVQNARVLIIDNIGMLAHLYRYGKWAYIGGGFGDGIHNTLEPIVFGLPVLFGPKYKKFEEAVQLRKLEAAFVINNYKDFKQAFTNLQEAQFYAKASDTAKQYVLDNKGATKHILHYIKTQLS